MLGYYKIDKDLIKNIGIKCQNIEENIYHLCCPLIVENKKSLPSTLRYLYELLEIPIIPYSKFNKDRIEENKELENKIKKFTYYLELNVDIEMEEEKSLGHLLRVGKYAKELAESLQLSKKEVDDIYTAALFHDIGKYVIPKEIIGKNGKLTDEEFELIKTHCITARDILGDFLEENVMQMVESHHERLDGSGYKNGITPSLGAQIIGIADSYDAMISKRVYHNAENIDSAFEELLLCTRKKEDGGKGMLYDKKLVQKFIQIQKKMNKMA